MNKYMALITIGLMLSGCANMALVNKDQDMMKKYPGCFHQYRSVFDRCIQLNDSGKKVNAIQTEELMKKEGQV